ncbi:bifunctional lysylphosphatidylglycerol flippase/synthetase MprF [Desulfobulbus sp.]|uniref:bifunctional lysylphosphatidylglycerol flippase/synthetase MprF n=1 Tax=Desulfobulbus sp. TaxID=895 RepID=UPI00286F7E88|nr:bifunctional lysylphosphatidylglycerol flippase/synthetase MprF [Desulfobulbus sp.]
MRRTIPLRILSPLLSLLLFGGALWILHRALNEIHYRDILHHLHALPPRQIAAALGLTSLSYLVMTGYDWLAIRYLRHPLAPRKVILTSFISYAFSNTIGLSLLTAGSIRYRLYTAWGLSTEEIARVLSFTVVTFWLGVGAAGGAVFATQPLALPGQLHLPFLSVRLLGLVFLVLVASYLAATHVRTRPFAVGGWQFSLPRPTLAWRQVLIGATDWVLAGSVLYALLPAGAHLSFVHFLGIFLLAQVVALVSHVPGGIGVFESMILLSLPQLPLDALAGSLMMYRAVYYLLPLTGASLLLGGLEFFRQRALAGRIVKGLARLGGSLVPQLMAASTLAGGAVLLFSGATPGHPGRLHWLHGMLPMPVMELSHFLGSLTGAGLLLVAWGLLRRLDAAYLLAVILLASGSLLSLLWGVDYEAAIVLGLMFLALLPCRHAFYRRSSLLSEPLSRKWTMLILLVMGCAIWLGFFTHKHVAYSRDLWWHFAISGDAPRFLRATVGAVSLLLFYATAHLLKPVRFVEPSPHLAGSNQARAVIAASTQTRANLALLGDKSLLFNPSDTAFIMYAIEGRSWVGLGDPIGPQAEHQELIWRFRELCEQAEGWPVFYEVGHDTLYLYLDLGLTLLKLGEEARVPLAGFSLEGKARSGLRYSHRKAEKEGSSFELVEAAAVPALLPELRHISDSWLVGKKTKEKGFSLGFFHPEYLQANPVALVRHGGRVVAFANVWLGAEQEEMSIDLMRFLPEAPNGTMDYLFISLILWAKQQGYGWFNLGMAPLAGLANRPHAPLWHRAGSLLYQHGEHFYNFKGLRTYKEKFDPVWEPRYLASPGGLALPRIMTNLATLISGGARGMVGK